MTDDFLRRYTSLPILLDILNKKCLTLLDPGNWEDKNDSYFIECYKKKSNLVSVLALCFAETTEKYHHWKIYSGDKNGVCIVFKKEQLLNYFEDIPGIRKGLVGYYKIKQLEKYHLNIDQLPFIKRYAFRDEQEFRIIYQDNIDEIQTVDIEIDVDCISKIIFNPWLPKTIFYSVRKIIQNIDGCSKIKVIRSALIESETWKNIVENQFFS